MLDGATEKILLLSQRNEITEHFIYEKLSDSVKDPHNKSILQRISRDELRHFDFWKNYTHREPKPGQLKIWKYYLLSKIFGITFAIKLMEKGEEKAQVTYRRMASHLPAAVEIEKEENDHEQELIGLIDEERLRYVGSMVLGLNDALMELTGALAGLTFALQNTSLVAMAVFITGIAGSLSMAASEYQSIKAEGGGRDPLKACMYTGSVYVGTVLFLIFPYLIFRAPYLCLGVTLANAVLLILLFSFYIAVAKDIPFGKRFWEMTGISLGIAGLSFIIGFLVRTFLNIDP